MQTTMTIEQAMNINLKFDLVILDYSVISEMGLKGYRKVKKHFRCPVILTSSAFPNMKKAFDSDHFVGKDNLREYMEAHA